MELYIRKMDRYLHIIQLTEICSILRVTRVQYIVFFSKNDMIIFMENDLNYWEPILKKIVKKVIWIMINRDNTNFF